MADQPILSRQMQELRTACQYSGLAVYQDGHALKPSTNYTHHHGWSMAYENGDYCIRLYDMGKPRSVHTNTSDCVYTMQTILGIK